MEMSFPEATLPIACCSWSFGALPVLSAISVARAVGFSHVDIGFEHLQFNDDVTLKQGAAAIKKTLRALEMGVADVFPLLPFETNDPSSKHREANDRVFETFLELAAELKSPGLTIKPGVVIPDEIDGGWVETIKTLGEYTRLAMEHGLTLSVEPHIDSIIEAPDRAKEMAESIPDLKLTLDYSHFVALGYRVEAVLPLNRLARHVHLRQARPGKLQTTMEDGVLSFRDIVGSLVAGGYTGVLATEFQHSEWGGLNEIDVVTETVAMLRSLGLAIST